MRTGLQQLNEQNKAGLWAGRIAACRNSGQSVKAWCKERGIYEASYYKWQKKIFTMVQAQRELQFAEVTPVMAEARDSRIALRIFISYAHAEEDLCNEFVRTLKRRGHYYLS